MTFFVFFMAKEGSCDRIANNPLINGFFSEAAAAAAARTLHVYILYHKTFIFFKKKHVMENGSISRTNHLKWKSIFFPRPFVGQLILLDSKMISEYHDRMILVSAPTPAS